VGSFILEERENLVDLADGDIKKNIFCIIIRNLIFLRNFAKSLLNQNFFPYVFSNLI
jgi:hypothetical protein